jgi:hypothetical protein
MLRLHSTAILAILFLQLVLRPVHLGLVEIISLLERISELIKVQSSCTISALISIAFIVVILVVVIVLMSSSWILIKPRHLLLIFPMSCK